MRKQERKKMKGGVIMEKIGTEKKKKKERKSEES